MATPPLAPTRTCRDCGQEFDAGTGHGRRCRPCWLERESLLRQSRKVGPERLPQPIRRVPGRWIYDSADQAYYGPGAAVLCLQDGWAVFPYGARVPPYSLGHASHHDAIHAWDSKTPSEMSNRVATLVTVHW